MSLELLILAPAIALNNVSTALALGALGQAERVWRVVSVFAIFEFSMPLIGYYLGHEVARWAGPVVQPLGPIVLAALGLWALWTAWREGTPQDVRNERLAARLTSWGGFVLLAAGLSVGNLVVGFSVGVGERIDPWALAASIAAVSSVGTYAGMRLGDRARRRHERMAEAASGLVLLALAGANALGWF